MLSTDKKIYAIVLGNYQKNPAYQLFVILTHFQFEFRAIWRAFFLEPSCSLQGTLEKWHESFWQSGEGPDTSRRKTCRFVEFVVSKVRLLHLPQQNKVPRQYFLLRSTRLQLFVPDQRLGYLKNWWSTLTVLATGLYALQYDGFLKKSRYCKLQNFQGNTIVPVQ